MKNIHLILFAIISSTSLAKSHSCQQPFTLISAIQGNSAKSPLVDQKVWTQGIVTADFRGKNNLSGYFIQSVAEDNDPNSSEGLFVHENNLQLPIKIGDLVSLQGQVTEQFGVTQLTGSQKTQICASAHPLPEAVTVVLPFKDLNLETLEGMRVTLAKPYVISDVYQYAQFGELVVSSALRMNPTSLHRPGPSVDQLIQTNQQNQLIIDDGSQSKYRQPFGLGADGQHVLGANNPIQLGQSLHTTGVMHYLFGQYKLQPTAPVVMGPGLKSSQNTPQAINGNFKVASFNVENFFTTLDNGEEICGPMKNFSCRGADNSKEYQRQLDKLVQVINTADAAVMGLQELENNAQQSIQSLVDALNKEANKEKWSFIDTGVLGKDVIKVALIYQVDQLQPQGNFALLNRAADKAFLENKNRVIVAQTFNDPQGHTFNIATVHFKSKNCRDAEGELKDQKDGQGCYNPTRTQVAKQLAKWLKSDPTEQQAEATFIVGDFNSYQKEDPMVALKSAGFANLADRYLPDENWTTSYRGAVGSLDYVLANEAAQQLTQDMTQWHINSVSMGQFGYNTEVLGDNVPKPDNFYQADPYASSDHDVVIVGFSF